MKRDAIDFQEVPAKQLAIHERLATDWVAYCHGSRAVNVSAMFRLYRSDEHWHQREVGPPRGDTLKGAHLNREVCKLPQPHRLALQWFYIVEGSPLNARKAIGCTMEGLRLYVVDARHMLINRGA